MNPKIGAGFQETEESDFGTIGGAVYATFAPWVVWNPGGNPSGTIANLGSAPASGQVDPGSTVSVTSGGIIFNLLFDAAAMAAPQSFRTGIQQAASILSGAISDHITVNLIIDYSGTGGGAAAGPDHGIYQTYSSVRTNLINGATAGDTSFISLPAGTSIQGQSNVAIWNAQLKLWGIIGANDTTTDDGSATFATDINPNLLVGVALHELTHAIGRVPYGPQPDIFDLFRYTSTGTMLFAGGNTAPAAYFSVDGGATKIADYGRTSDPSDFFNSGVQGSTDPFNEFYNGATAQYLTPIDLRQLDVLGFHLVGAPVNHAPVVTIPSTVVSASAGQTFSASSLFGASDADGNTLTYSLYDDGQAANSGHFVVNGTVVPAGTAYTVTAAQLAQLTFVAGAAGTSDDLYVRAYDGQAYSNNGIYSYFHVNVAGNHAPVVTVPSTVVSASAGQTLSAASLFSVSDADGNTLTYSLYDDGQAANSGHFVVNGTVVPAGTAYTVTAAQLAQTTFVAGAAGTSDDLYVRAYDGQAYSNNGIYSYFHINVAGNHAPVVTVPSTVVSASAGQTLSAASLFSASDADGNTLTYSLYDDGQAANSGHFVVNGTVVPAGTAYTVTAAQLAQTTFVAGAAGTSDDLYVRAYDGQAYSNNGIYSYFHVNASGNSATGNHAPVVTIPSTVVSASAGQTLSAASLFGASDADGDTLTYSLYDDSAAANSGHFVVNGTVVPAGTAYTVTAAQLAQTTFVAGAAGTSDDLYVRAYDGQAYSNNGIYSYFHVNTGTALASASAIAGDNFVFAPDLGNRAAVNSIQGAADNYVPHFDLLANHFNQLYAAVVAAANDAGGGLGTHPDAMSDPLALFGLHATGHTIDHSLF